MIHRFTFLALLGCLLGGVASAAAEPLTLAPGHTFIVAPAQTSNTLNLATRTLRDNLRRATHSETGFDIVPENKFVASADQVILAVGKTSWSAKIDLTPLAPQAFVLLRQDNTIIMTGPGDLGVLYAAVDFLDRCAGVRFYMPTDLFTSMPASPVITVDKLDVTSAPYVSSSFFSGIDTDNKGDYEWMLRIAAYRRVGGTHQHNMWVMFPPAKYAGKYPEIYPTYEGKRFIPTGARDQTWQINFMEPHTLDAAMETIRDYFARAPQDQYIACSMNDGGRFDDGPATHEVVQRFIQQRGDSPETRARAYSSIYWDFMAKLAARMAAEFPGKQLVGLAYGPSRFPPDHRLPENVTAFTNFHIAELPSDGILDSKNNQPPLLDQWAKAVSHMGNHDWYQGSGYLTPRIYTRHWVRFLQAMQKNISAPYMHVESYPNWGLDGLKYYVLARLFWDPKTDTDALLKQMCNDLFGPAGDAMQRYFTTAEDLWVQINNVEGPERKLMAWGTQFQTTPKSMAMVNDCMSALEEATRLASTDEQRQRVAVFHDFFSLSRSLFVMAASNQPDEAYYQKTVALAQDLTTRPGLVAHHRQRLMDAVKAVHWEQLKRATRPVTAPLIPTPQIDGQLNEAAWSKALKDQKFVQDSGSGDSQSTTLWLGADSNNLYLAVICPRSSTREYVETPDDIWRSDNVEVFFDFDGNPKTNERQMWVKTTGRVVNWSGRFDKTPVDLRGAVSKEAGRYVVEMAIPLSYAGFAENRKSVNIRVVRNEFTTQQGMNVDTYAAVWTRTLKLEKP